MTDAGKWVTVERVFDATIQRVWQLWTDPVEFQTWYGPKGFSVPVAEMDLTIGGTRKICMQMKTPERDMVMWFIGKFVEIDAPNRLVYSEAMCQEDGTLIPPASMGMPEGTPDFTEVQVALVEVDGKTHMTMIHAGVPAGSPGEGGWNMAFDKLEGVL